MAARSPRRILLALSACLLLVLALAWALGRRPGPGAAPQPAAVVAPEIPDVATAPPSPAAQPALPEERDPGGIPHTELPLRLLATIVSENPAHSLATVQDLERAVEVMNEGQGFEGRPDVQIARIERARILIDNDGVREQLVIVHRGAQEAAPVSPEEREHRRDLSRRLRELTDAGENYEDVLGEGTREGLLGEGDVSPVYEDGQMVGVQLDDIREGGFYDRLGLRNGDVVTGINGVSVSDPAAMVKVIDDFMTAPELSIAVERGADGAPETLVVSTSPLRQELAGFERPPAE